MTDHTLNTLGLALRSGNLAVGEEPAAEACKSKRARLLLAASDAAENTLQKAARLAERCGVPLVMLPYEKSQVGFHLGRGVCALMAVTDAGFAASLVRQLAVSQPETCGALAEELEAKARRTQQRKKARVREKQRQTGASAGKQKHGTVN